eukprot:4381033-Ditylum_brightwellii.AAC.1
MDVFGSLKPSTLTLERLNTVCFYLGALTLSDIVTDNNTSIMEWALTGRTRTKTMLPWPNQNKPSAVCWQPLGRWLTKSLYTAREHYHSGATNEVYELQDGTFHIYKARQNRMT